MQEVIVRVWGSVTHGNAVEQYIHVRALLTRRHGLWRCEDGNVVLGAAWVELRQAFRRRKPQRWACPVARVLSVGWLDHIRNLDTSLVVFLRGICSGLGPLKVGLSTDSSPRKRCTLARHL